MNPLLSVPSCVPVNWKFLAWAIVSTAPERSVAHFDAGRYAAWIHVITGTKMFFIRDDVDHNTTPSEPCTREPTKYKWTAVVLRAGHKL